ncbi:hypothetical protein HU200_038314 [Digitaria exilis]|uniref:Protein kinase domain-containing protein n=1 Tax=Digitaria exilis TaxID=1010633 RepID=A0A835BBP8_9POAL|nr:hypothetical protein HU200_038314 [Digitaria exilis]
MDEEKFTNEVECMMKVKHKNIVRFLGYCSEAHGRMSKCRGKNVMAEELHRLLCLEYLPNGSLDTHINACSGRLAWRERYQIIMGICEGLYHLHESVSYTWISNQQIYCWIIIWNLNC